MTSEIVFWLLCLLFIGFVAGWVAKVDFDRYKADQKREQGAKERRLAYEQNKEYIKQINRRKLFVSWCEAAKGGAKK